MLLVLELLALASAAPLPTRLTPWGSHSIRVQVAPQAVAIQDPPIMALLDSAPASSTPVTRSSDGLSLTNGNLRVDLDASSALLTATRVSDGKVLLQQTNLRFANPTVPARPGSVSAFVAFEGTAGERVYGLGEHRTGRVQQSPYFKRFEQSQDYSLSSGGDVSIPWYASSKGYGFVWNSPAFGYVNISEAQIAWFANTTLNVDLWITTCAPGKESVPFADLLAHYVDAVGHAPQMPDYATGFIQCKDRYRNQSQLLDVARGYAQRDLAVGVIVIDWYHWVAQGDWHFNPACWPDPQGMVDELRALGIELMVTFWPFQTNTSRYWAEFSQQGMLVRPLTGGLLPYDSNQYLIDITNASVRQTVFAHFWDGYGQYGIKNIWLDAAEPEHFGAQLDGQWILAKGGDGEVMQGWIKEHVRMVQEGMASKHIAPEDYFVLPRHAWAGSWRYSAALWSGDIASTFEELALQIKVLQGVMMSGITLWTTDIGGYRDGDPSDKTFQELIVRWFQFGAFCPLFRLHGHRSGGPPPDQCGPTNGDNEVWNLATGDHYDAIVAVMRKREDLRQYVKTINAEASATGMPMVRPMFLEFPLDPLCVEAEDQFMFG